jgi:hypothetical protein
MFYANPFGLNDKNETVDPGFNTTVKLFQNQNKTDSNGNYSYTFPEGYDVQPIDACKLSIETTAFSSVQEMVSTGTVSGKLYGNLSGGRGLISAQANGEAQYKSSTKKTTTESMTYTKTEALCGVFRAVFQDYAPPQLDTSFITALKQLNTKNFDNVNERSYFYEFVNKFGSHYVREAIMGSKFSAFREIATGEYEEKKTSGWKFSAEASYSYTYFQEKYNSEQTDKQRSVSDKYDNQDDQDYYIKKQAGQNYDKYTFTYIGVSLPVNENSIDTITWDAKTRFAPKLAGYKLDTINNLLEIQALRKSLKSLGVTNISLVSQGIDKAIKSFCSGYMIPQGLITSCEISTAVTILDSRWSKDANEVTDQSSLATLNNLDVTCFSGSAVSSFVLQKKESGKYAYSFKCARTEAVSDDCLDLSTIPQTFNTFQIIRRYHGKIWYKPLTQGLSNQNLKCQAGRVLQSFKLLTLDKVVYYDYKCCKAKIDQNLCNSLNPGSYDGSNYASILTTLENKAMQTGKDTNLMTGFSYVVGNVDKDRRFPFQRIVSYCSINKKIN